jgi:hypothetical protein
MMFNLLRGKRASFRYALFDIMLRVFRRESMQEEGKMGLATERRD